VSTQRWLSDTFRSATQKAAKRALTRILGWTAGIVALVALSGCETMSWFDPSRTGYFEFTPTTLPVLSRIDVVEPEVTSWSKSVPPSVEDLQPGELQYRLAAGDEVRVEVYELVSPGQTDVALRVVDPSGTIRLPTIGEVTAGGLTVAQLQKEIEDRLRGFLSDPIVSVVLERGQGFNFVIYGAISGTGVYSLTRPDFRLMDALALAGGTFSTTENVYVIRSAPLESSLSPSYGDTGLKRPDAGGPAKAPDAKPVDIEDLINKLPGSDQPPADDPNAPKSPSPGMLGPRPQDGTKPPIDIDDLQTTQPVTAPTAQEGQPGIPNATGWTWDTEKQIWVRSATATGMSPGAGDQTPRQLGEPQMFATRIIQIDYDRLARGDSNLNIVVRPGDRIYVDPPLVGVVYIGGEVSRPGVYELPQTGGKLTLSRLVDAAGGLSQLAIPERVDLIRRVGPGREAAIRVNLGAIRLRSEPDIVMKPDDHVLIGTNFFATPLAVIRNGFRMTYGFGFLLDRNFGNDVFGPPPTNVLGE
jgi:polysaccharide export outer membrane protein